MKLYVYIILFVVGIPNILFTQNCDLAVLSKIHSYKTDGFTIEWLDFNDDPLYWEIEFGFKNFQRDFQADISNINSLSYEFSNLQSGTAYEIYIRTACSDIEKSAWNGPYFINTAIENGQQCEIELSIGDNNCPVGNDFYIQVLASPDDSLGVNLVLDKIELIIAHPWPPDIEVTLSSPQGRSIRLSSFNGNGTDDYGNSNSIDCSEKFVFSDNACLSIDQAVPPFIGDYKPEEDFTHLFDTQSPNGLWTLNICDRASGDIGKLKHVNLQFSTEACVVPQSFQIIDIEADNIELIWDPLENCTELQISYKEVGAPISETSSDFESCAIGSFKVVNLKPDTEYELYIISICDADSNSPQSCLLNFTTSCINSNIRSHFDSLQVCPSRCDAQCIIDDYWRNDEENASNWLLKNGETPTDLTGPPGDKNKTGNYIYIENQKNTCPGDIFTTLISSCLTNQILSGCSMSFYYHMYGEDVGQLLLQSSTDSITWTTLWSKNGDQGETWHLERIEIDQLFQAGLLRFVAQSTSNALRGDIALDDIKLISLETIDPVKYYIDSDSDGFGDISQSIMICASISPQGYVANADDCNDNDPEINPNAIEITCNLIDENCNGLADDISNDDIEYSLVRLVNETCKGESDGLIELVITQGTGPFTYNWNNGVNDALNMGLSTGVYFCTITGAAGCQTITDPIFVDFDNILLYSVNSVVNPVCSGQSTGMISIMVDGGLSPYEIVWNNGMTGNTISNLPDGTYYAELSDAKGCKLQTDPIQVLGSSVITSGVALKSDLNCFNDNSGLIQLGITGGEAPYSIDWNNGDSSSFINQLSAGTYSVTIEDANGCVNILSNIIIAQPEDLSIKINNVEDISCFGKKSGQIDIDVIGGSEPYSYFWSSGAFSQDLFNVAAGIYDVTVTDFNACRKELSGIIIQQNSEISIDLDSINFANCKGSETGYIEVDVSGGTVPYSYNWSTSDGSGTGENYIENLTPGKYFLTVVDNLSCKSSSATFEIVNLDVAINISLEIQDSLKCYGDSDASVIAQSLRGSSPFDYNWSSGENILSPANKDTINGLQAGSYNLTITDAEGCVGISDSILINSPDELNYEVESLINNLCYDGEEGEIQINVSGGTTPYSVMWNNSQNGLSNTMLKNGIYSARVSDNNQCILESAEISISSPPKINLDLIVMEPTENIPGSIEVMVSGGTPPYIFNWKDPLNFLVDSIANGLSAGDYSITITDSFGCNTDTLISLNTVANSNILAPDFKLFPNPVDHKLFFSGDDHKNFTIEMYNLKGQKIIESMHCKAGETLVIDVAHIPNGLYFICIINDNREALLKISVIH